MSVNTNTWEVYNLWRTSKLNVLYYSTMQKRYTVTLKIFDIFLAAATPGSAIATFALWKSKTGGELWQAIIIVAAIVALIKPALNLTAIITKTDTILSGYKLMSYDLEELIKKIRRNGKYGNDETAIFDEINLRKRTLITQDPEIKSSFRLRNKFTIMINEELSQYDFYLPEA